MNSRGIVCLIIFLWIPGPGLGRDDQAGRWAGCRVWSLGQCSDLRHEAFVLDLWCWREEALVQVL